MPGVPGCCLNRNRLTQHLDEHYEPEEQASPAHPEVQVQDDLRTGLCPLWPSALLSLESLCATRLG